MFVLYCYLYIGLASGIYWLSVCYLEDYRGLTDQKFGPAWKSMFTYVVFITIACPIVNLFWVWIIVTEAIFERK